jgi:hypothetical protein
MPAAWDDSKRCTKCREVKPPAEFSRDRSRKDGRAPWCKACVRRWQRENAKHMADYHRRWQRANRDKRRRYLERKRKDPEWREGRRANGRRRDRERRAQDPDYVERRRADNRRYRERKRARVPDALRGANDGSSTSLAGWHHSPVVRSNPKTAADERFEAYLSEHRIPFKYEPDWADEFGIDVEDNPDYLLDPDGARVICEMKQFESTWIKDRL